MEALLLTNLAATLVMVGVAWFVAVVHYPLFAEVGRQDFRAYHDLHSPLTTRVVLPPMVVELASSVALPFAVDGSHTLAWAGAGLAAATWLLTFAAAVPAHKALGDGFDPAALVRLRRAHAVRTLVWLAHGAVAVALTATLLG